MPEVNINNGLIIDCEVQKCIPSQFFTYNPDDSDSPTKQYLNYQLNYLENNKHKWTSDYLKTQIEKYRDDLMYEFCTGFEDYENMGISCVSVWDLNTNTPFTFFDCPEDLDDLQELIKERDFIVGYNNIKFDNNLLRANGIELKPSFDLLRAIWKAAKLDPDNFNINTHKGYGLDSVSAINSGLRKLGQGTQAPKLYQDGKLGQLVRYGMRDVMMTRSVFLRAIKNDLVSPVTGKILEIKFELELQGMKV